ncbi:MAG: hypothetical protein RLZZ344_443 [Pseudomonadota bacterium]|jgi:DNA-binding NarL/FixJ family response regulator
MNAVKNTKVASPKRAVIVVEDHPLYVDALVALVASHHKAHSVRSCATVKEAEVLIRMEAKAQGIPPIVLLDLAIPDISGISAIQFLKASAPDSQIAIISASDDYIEVSSCISAGADIFVSKTALPEQIVAVVGSLLRGDLPEEKWMSATGFRPVDTRHAVRLTDRQREVLELVCQGRSNKEIAATLQLAEITTKAHVSAIFRELRVANRTQALLAAKKLGLQKIL